MRYIVLAVVISVFGALSSFAQTVTPYEYYRTPIWTMYQQYWKHAFDACIAERNDLENGQRFTVGRAISGEDFIMVHNMKALIAEGEETLSGKVWINGKTPYDFSGVKPTDSAVTPGEKYVSIFLHRGFVDDFAKASSVDVAFSKGRSKHSLKGSRDVIQRLNSCIDEGLTRELDPPPAAPPPLVTPLTWTAGADVQGRYIWTKLPPHPKMGDVFYAYAESSPGRFDVRLRKEETGVATRLDAAANGAQRFAANITMNGKPAFATLVIINGDNFDIVDIPAADLAKLGIAGKMEITPLDPSQPQSAVLELTADASFGAGVMVSSQPVTATAPQPTTLETLVGSYFVRGKNPNGSYYYGSAETVMEGGNLRINWKWTNDKTDTAVASMIQNVVTAVVTGLNAPAIYTIGKDGTWRGTWDNGKATEIMVPKL